MVPWCKCIPGLRGFGSVSSTFGSSSFLNVEILPIFFVSPFRVDAIDKRSFSAEQVSQDIRPRPPGRLPIWCLHHGICIEAAFLCCSFRAKHLPRLECVAYLRWPLPSCLPFSGLRAVSYRGQDHAGVTASHPHPLGILLGLANLSQSVVSPLVRCGGWSQRESEPMKKSQSKSF